MRPETLGERVTTRLVNEGWWKAEPAAVVVVNRNDVGQTAVVDAGNSHLGEDPDTQQSLFSWAKFMAEEPPEPQVETFVLISVGVGAQPGARGGPGQRGKLTSRQRERPPHP